MKFASAILKEIGYGLDGSRGPCASTVTPGKNMTAAVAPPTNTAATRALTDLFALAVACASVEAVRRAPGILHWLWAAPFAAGAAIGAAATALARPAAAPSAKAADARAASANRRPRARTCQAAGMPTSSMAGLKLLPSVATGP